MDTQENRAMAHFMVGQFWENPSTEKPCSLILKVKTLFYSPILSIYSTGYKLINMDFPPTQANKNTFSVLTEL